MRTDKSGLNRREAIASLTASAGLAVATPTDAFASGTATSPATTTTLWYAQPARNWVEALPVGNGRISAMVHGGTDHEFLQLNEDTLWSGGPYDPANPDAQTALPEVRRLVFAGQFADAATLVGQKLMGKPVRQMPYSTMGTLVISHAGAPAEPEPEPAPSKIESPVTPIEAAQPVDGFRRELDLDTAIATTRWVKDGVTFKRDVLASAVDQVIAVRITADRPGKLDLDLSIRSPLRRTAAISGRTNEIVLQGQNDPANGVDGALKLEARVRAATRGGSVEQSDGQLHVRGANEVLILIAMATSYRRFDDVGGDPSAITKQQIDRAGRRSWSDIATDSISDHRRLFRRASLDLGETATAKMPTDQRIRASEQSEDPALATLYFNYARYLLIASSRPGSQPANLQGIWNGSTNPPWGGKYTININTEMNYWPAEVVGLGECVEPLVAMVRDLSITGARTARTMYGARGWVCHHNTDLWRASAPIDAPNYGMWPTGGAWLCTHLWDHYDYNRDKTYLATIYPILRDAALFFVDTLQIDPNTGSLVTNPSMSPEHNHGHGASICAGPTMDMSILRDLFDQAAKAATTLGRDPELARQFLATRSKLAPFKIGQQGQLQEWQQDWDAGAPDQHHRHVSHLYAVFPSQQIDVEHTPDLAAAAKRSLEIRGDEATGWATAWRIALWARLRDGNHAHRILRFLVGPKRTYPNMFDAHPPFQIDGNFGGAAAIAEMLLSSTSSEIFLLPALPDAWPRGEVKGLHARGSCTVDLAWRDGRLVEATATSRIGGRYVFRCGTEHRELNLKAGVPVRLKGARLLKA